MYTDTLISAYKYTFFKFDQTHTVGSTVLFKNPCIGYIVKGKAQILYKGKNYYATEGDVIYIAKDTKYYSVWTGEPEIEFHSIGLSFAKPYSFYEYRFQIVKDYPNIFFNKMHETYTTDIYLSISNLYCLLSDLYKRMIAEDLDFCGKTRIQPAIDYIENNYNAPISIETLGKLCHSCSSGFFKQFKSATGVTPIAYKHNIMIQNALDLLAHSDLTIEEISEKVGFSSSNYFRKVFFDITGKTPKEVR